MAATKRSSRGKGTGAKPGDGGSGGGKSSAGGRQKQKRVLHAVGDLIVTGLWVLCSSVFAEVGVWVLEGWRQTVIRAWSTDRGGAYR